MAFIDLTNVEIVDEVSEDAKVLVEENGEIKRAPKSEVGGAVVGSIEPDMVITVNDYSSKVLTSDNCAITEGSIDNVFAAFREGRYPIVKIRFHSGNNEDYVVIREEYDAYVCTYGENLWFSFTTLNPCHSINFYVHKYYMTMDGTFTNAEVRKATLTTTE